MATAESNFLAVTRSPVADLCPDGMGLDETEQLCCDPPRVVAAACLRMFLPLDIAALSILRKF